MMTVMKRRTMRTQSKSHHLAVNVVRAFACAEEVFGCALTVGWLGVVRS